MKGFLSMAIFAIGLSAGAQTSGTLKGQIHDTKGDALPAGYASVDVGGSEIKVAVDETGHFTIKPLNSGTYVLTIGSMGFQEAQYEVVIKSDQVTTMNDLVLGDDVTILEKEVKITEYRDPLINPYETNKVELDAKILENNPNRRSITDLVGGSSSEVKKSNDGELYFRGSRSDGVIQFIDGVKQTGTISSLPGRAIGRVAVYTGAIPAKYGDTTSGVIVLETQSYFDLYYARMAKK